MAPLDEGGVRAAVSMRIEGNRTLNARLSAEPFADDAVWINAFGARFVGRRAIEDWFARLYADQGYAQRDTFDPPRIAEIVFVRPDVAVARVFTRHGNQRLPDGRVIEERRSHNTMTLTREPDGWKVRFEIVTDERERSKPSPLGQRAPGMTPERFAPGTVCTEAIELNAVLSPDGREFYFTRVVDGVDTMFQIRFVDGGWSGARELLLFPGFGRIECADMTLSPDGQDLYFMSAGPTAPDQHKNYDVWHSRRLDGEWSAAARLPAPVNTDADEYYPVIGPDGSLYVNSTRDGQDIFRFPREPDGRFGDGIKVGPPVASKDGDMCISPDGNCMIISAQRPRIGGSWKSDLHVSFRDRNGTWSDFVALDDTFNTPDHEWCPMFSPDGKYLFFSRRFGAYDTPPDWTGTTDGEVYWVDARSLERYRPTQAR